MPLDDSGRGFEDLRDVTEAGPTMHEHWKPAAPRRLWGWIVATVPSKLMLLFARASGEDAFSAGAGGDWSWYPLAGTWKPRNLNRHWNVAGRGAAVVGQVERSGNRLRFIPSAFWRERDFADWMVTVTGEEQDNRWLRLTTPDGTVVLRKRRTT